MGAGISRERRYRIVYNGLRKIQSELAAQGVQSTYKNRELRGSRPDGSGFLVAYGFMGASNGESCMWPVAEVKINGIWTAYNSLPWMPGLSFEKDAKPVIVANFKTEVKHAE